MKTTKKIWLIGFTFLTTLIFIWACNKENQTKPSSDALKVPPILNGFRIGDILLPDGTTTKILNSGNKVEYFYPKGIKYVGKQADGNFEYFESGCYECSGDCTKGCDVISAMGTFGCSACENGNACTGKTCKSGNESLSKAGFVDFNVGLKFLYRRDKDRINSMLSGPDFIFDLPKVKSELAKLNKELYGVENPTNIDKNSCKQVMMNLFGTAIKYWVPKSYIENFNNQHARTNVDEMLDDAEAKVTCTCKDTTPVDCKLESGMLGSKCVSGNCVTCQMKN